MHLLLKKSKFIPRHTWITNGIMISVETKQKLYNKWKIDPSNNILKNNYKSFAKLLKKNNFICKK